MLRILFSFLFCFCSLFSAFPQYATKGNGALKDAIWWFNWAGLRLADGESRTFNTTDGLTIKIDLSNVTGDMVPNVMNTWSGAMLHYLYDFNDPSIQPAMHSRVLSNATCTIKLTVSVTRAGLPVPFTFVASDAEGSSPDEYTTLVTNGSAWQTIEYFRNVNTPVNPLLGCNTQTVRINHTSDASNVGGRNPLLVTNSANGNMVVDVKLERTVLGGMAVAFGIMAPIDRGDLPVSYGAAQHQLYYSVIDACNYLPPFPSIRLTQPLFIGTVPGDADGYQTTDDNANGADEDGVPGFPPYDNSGTYTLPVAVTNQTGADAYLSGYFDYNRNGQFEAGEEVRAIVPDNTSSVTLNWTGLPVWLPIGAAKEYGFRFRISSDPASAQKPAGIAVDGEVEDYIIPFDDLCNIKVKTVNDTSVCPGKPVQLSTTGGLSYTWNKSDYLDNAGIAGPVAKAEVDMEYIVSGSNPQGCVAKDTVYITVMPVPVITTSGDISICRGSTVTLSANAPGAVKYSWLPVSGLDDATAAQPVASPGVSTEYTVEAEGANGCIASRKLKVDFWPLPVFTAAGSSPEICLSKPVTLTADGADQYTWLAPDNTVLSTNPELEITPGVTMTYRVELRSLRCGETDVLSVPVVVNPLPATGVTKSNDIDCKYGEATLKASGGSSYRWDAMAGISDLRSPSPVVTPVADTKYYVTVYSNKGCEKKDSVVVEVDLTKSLSSFPVASAFTPNNDGKNDCFGLKTWSRVTALDFSVYTRHGQRVFQSNDPGKCWDGKFNGEMLPGGGYVYQIKATTICGTVYRKGIVMLVR